MDDDSDIPPGGGHTVESPVEGAGNNPTEEPATVEDVATAAIVEGEIIAESVQSEWQIVHQDLQEIKNLLQAQQSAPAPQVSSLEPPEPPLAVEAPAAEPPAKRRSPYSTRTR